MVHYTDTDLTFAALADTTRRGILERLGAGPTTISELADQFGMTLTGLKKHVQVLESAGLLTSHKTGRVRSCTLGPRRLDEERAWIRKYHEMLDARVDRLEQFLERTKDEEL